MGGTNDTHGQRKKLSRGERAERVVAARLSTLPADDFIVLNDVQATYGNIDHLVIRHDGAIFLIETKSHVGTVTWNGRELLLSGKPFRKNYLCQTNRNIRWLRREIKANDRTNPWVVAILIFPFARVKIRGPAKRINVLGLNRLRSVLRCSLL